MTKRIIILFFALTAAACSRTPSDLEQSLRFAGGNRAELEKVLNHYRASGDKQKLKAAKYLIANMPLHVTHVGNQIDEYRNLLLANDVAKQNVVLDSLWNSIKDTVPAPQKVSHTSVVNAQFLQNEIDEAFLAWDRAPWKDSISFDVFLHHIVPYSINDEPLFPYRKMMCEKYAPLIEGIQSPKIAFDVIYYKIVKDYKLGNLAFPYTPDPVMNDRLMRGQCEDRTLFVVSVARALCIPAAFDHVTSFSNYSDKGHSWVTYIGGDGTKVFTVGKSFQYTDVQNILIDSVSYNNGLIDGLSIGSDFKYDYKRTGHNMDSVKTIAKIWRKSFQHHVKKGVDYQNKLISTYFPIHSEDVSRYYDLSNHTFRFVLEKPIRETVYLCTFLSGQKWVPVDASRPKGKKVKFKNVSKSIVYSPMYINVEGDLAPAGNPVIFYHDNTQKVLNPVYSQTESVTLLRKYTLPSLWIPRWLKAVKCRFELSDDPDFNPDATVLMYEISEIPVGSQLIDVNPAKAYRYARFMKPANEVYDPRNNNIEMAEISFYATSESGVRQEVSGVPFGKLTTGANIQHAFDKDYLSKVEIKAGEWFAIDFGNPQYVTSFEYRLRNDANFVEKGHHYELFYYDMEWKSLGVRFPKTYYLTYDDVPKNALLWLRDYSKGKEERIFTYENDKQVWW